MATKFTDSEKWRDKWFRALKPNEKLVFVFLIDQCNHAGFYELDAEYMSFCIGISQDEVEGAIQGLNRGCFVADGWIWVKNHIRHQRNEPLNPSNSAHRNIIERVREQVGRFASIPEFAEFLGAHEGLFSPIGNGIGKSNGNGNGNPPARAKKYPAGFEAFWSEYPRKDGSKSKAYDYWKRDKLEPRTAEIIAKLAEYRRTPQWMRDAGQYIPYPQKWLNERRYESNPEAVNGTQRPMGTDL